MGYSVFISHSTNDLGLVTSLSNVLEKFGVRTHAASWYLSPGQPLDKKVFAKIDGADSVVVLLTQRGKRSSWVNQEIGYALKSRKLIIPLVQKGVPRADLGAIRGREYIEFDSRSPEDALTNAASFICKKALKKKERDNAMLVTGGIVAFLLLLSGATK